MRYSLFLYLLGDNPSYHLNIYPLKMEQYIQYEGIKLTSHCEK